MYSTHLLYEISLFIWVRWLYFNTLSAITDIIPLSLVYTFIHMVSIYYKRCLNVSPKRIFDSFLVCGLACHWVNEWAFLNEVNYSHRLYLSVTTLYLFLQHHSLFLSLNKIKGMQRPLAFCHTTWPVSWWFHMICVTFVKGRHESGRCLKSLKCTILIY